MVVLKEVSIYDTDGKLLKKENIIDYTRENVIGEYASLENFIRKWSDSDKKEEIKNYFVLGNQFPDDPEEAKKIISGWL